MKKIFFVILLFINAASLSVEKSYEDGKSYGGKGISLVGMENHIQEFQQTAEQAAGFSTDNDTVLADRGGQELKGKFGKILYDSETQAINGREEHQINKQNTFYKDSFLLEQNPLQKTGGKKMQHKSKVDQEITEHCEEGVSFEVDLISQLTYVPPPRQQISTELTIYYPEYVKNVGFKNDEIAPMSVNTTNYQINLQRFREHVCPHFKPIDAVTGQTYKIDCNRINNFTLVRVVDLNRVTIVDKYGLQCQPVKLLRLSYKHDTYQSEEGSKNFWNILNPADEELVEKHNCYETKRVCLDSGEKHFDELIVNRPCWKEQISYHCMTQPEDGCKHLKDKNCTLQEGSSCQEYSDLSKKFCIRWKHPYKCLVNDEVMSSMIEGGSLFCMDGGCFNPEVGRNADLNEAVAKLEVMRAMGSKENFIGGEPPKVFPGDPRGCNKILAGFKNCCQTKGWGISLNLAGCSAEDEELAKKRNKGFCHYIDTYCAEKMPITGICIRKKSVYCCFQSKLSRIFHEQGRPQLLGRGWGDPRDPDCRPFTVDELTRMDFSKMDLSEIFADVFNRVGETARKAVPRQMVDQMPVMQSKIDEMRNECRKNLEEGYDDQTTRSSF